MNLGIPSPVKTLDKFLDSTPLIGVNFKKKKKKKNDFSCEGFENCYNAVENRLQIAEKRSPNF